ncbi:MAG TPA: helix-turn-helix domain-containing protein [Actinocrinis sp.]|jgi:AcrR family transcriptional regulator|uniref:TetR/AcrR family transcriptional regulator n=1 Tax=Actinocrinis sp. TaxID=1920516 RepID=UPI002D3D437E|nr:helix-turn-helix domain-containing protein [Actinocrinis sp.]HZU55786.1 helix-turn-helix domain-containing protein [Actinocrinis sp.]
MTSADAGAVTIVPGRRPQRADARRNYEKLLAVARDAFAEDSAVTLEEIARRAHVGIGTLYRHFPNRPALLEGIYVEQVEELCRSARELTEVLPPWDALVGWLHRYVGYVGTKRALAEQLTAALGAPTEVFGQCRQALFAEGEPLLTRAQDAGAVRTDVTFEDVLRMVSGITMATFTEEGQMERVLDIALDGLRAR